MADAIGQLSYRPSILDPSQICQQSNSYSSYCKDGPFWIESAAYKTSLAQSFFIEVPVANPVEWAVKHNSVQPSLQ
jgi:hypothetical protein